MNFECSIFAYMPKSVRPILGGETTLSNWIELKALVLFGEENRTEYQKINTRIWKEFVLPHTSTFQLRYSHAFIHQLCVGWPTWFRLQMLCEKLNVCVSGMKEQYLIIYANSCIKLMVHRCIRAVSLSVCWFVIGSSCNRNRNRNQSPWSLLLIQFSCLLLYFVDSPASLFTFRVYFFFFLNHSALVVTFICENGMPNRFRTVATKCAGTFCVRLYFNDFV